LDLRQQRRPAGRRLRRPDLLAVVERLERGCPGGHMVQRSGAAGKPGLTAATLVVGGQDRRSLDQAGESCALAERSKVAWHPTERNPGQGRLEGGGNDGDDAACHPILELLSFVAWRERKICAARRVGGGHQVHWRIRSTHTRR